MYTAIATAEQYVPADKMPRRLHAVRQGRRRQGEEAAYAALKAALVEYYPQYKVRDQTDYKDLSRTRSASCSTWSTACSASRSSSRSWAW